MCENTVGDNERAQEHLAKATCSQLGFDGGAFKAAADTPDGPGSMPTQVASRGMTVCAGEETRLDQCLGASMPSRFHDIQIVKTDLCKIACTLHDKCSSDFDYDTCMAECTPLENDPNKAWDIWYVRCLMEAIELDGCNDQSLACRCEAPQEIKKWGYECGAKICPGKLAKEVESRIAGTRGFKSIS